MTNTSKFRFFTLTEMLLLVALTALGTHYSVVIARMNSGFSLFHFIWPIFGCMSISGIGFLLSYGVSSTNPLIRATGSVLMIYAAYDAIFAPTEMIDRFIYPMLLGTMISFYGTTVNLLVILAKVRMPEEAQQIGR